MFGKSPAVIADRRDAKVKATNTIIQIAERYPKTVLYSHKIPDDQVELNVKEPLNKLWNGMTATDRETYRTAKGCNSPAPDTTSVREPNFLGYLQRGATATNVHCYGAYTQGLYSWLKQIVRLNPNTFPNGVGEHERLVQRALERIEGKEKAYSKDPTVRDPESTIEAKYLMLYFAANSQRLAAVEWENSRVIWPADKKKEELWRNAKIDLVLSLSKKGKFAIDVAALLPNVGSSVDALLAKAYTAYVDGVLPTPADLGD